MASHHHHHHHQTTTCCSTCHCCNPSPPQTDAILQAMASLLLQQQQQQPPQKSHFFRSRQKQPDFARQKSYFSSQDDIFGVLSSLLSRIDALESSLQHLSSSSPGFKSYPSCSLRDAGARIIQTHFRAFLARRSKTLRQLKELAIFKSRFSSLKLSISSEAQFDYDSVSQKAMDLLLKIDSIQGGDPMIRDGKRSLSRGLVQFLEYINRTSANGHRVLLRASKNVRLSGDSSKFRALSTDHREGSNRDVAMAKLKNRVGKVCGQCRVFSDDAEDEVELEGFHQVIDEAENARNFVNRKKDVCVAEYRNGAIGKRQGHQPTRVKRNVSFAENGSLYTVSAGKKNSELSSSADGTLTDESVSSDDNENGGDMENSGTQLRGLAMAKDEEEADLKGEESLESSDEESNAVKNLSSVDGSEREGHQMQDGSLMFAAPLPVKMESRADLVKKRKGVTFNIVS